MQKFTDAVLATFDSAIRKLGPVNGLIDNMVSRIAPTVEAKAGCSGVGCSVYACYTDGVDYGCLRGQTFVIWRMASQPQNCPHPDAGLCGGCDLFGSNWC